MQSTQELSTNVSDNVYAIKCRKHGEHVYRFLTPKGGETRLRIHAAQITGKVEAEQKCERIARDNPEFEFKVVPF